MNKLDRQIAWLENHGGFPGKDIAQSMRLLRDVLVAARSCSQLDEHPALAKYQEWEEYQEWEDD